MVRLQIGLITTSHAGRKPGYVTLRHRVRAIEATIAGTKSSQPKRTP